MGERTCAIEGCEQPHKARGLCREHYTESIRVRNNNNRRTDGFKECRDCALVKPQASYPRHSGYTDGYRPMCNDCYNARLRADWAADRNDIKAKQLARSRRFEYGASPEKIALFLEAQDFQCGVCQQAIGETQTDFHVDHDHKTGAMRGLLCHRCNRALGLFGDDEDGLLAALIYLTKPPFGLDRARSTA